MKIVVLLLTLIAGPAYAAEHCSIGLANKFAKGVIAVEVKENNYRAGKLVFTRNASHEYTKEYLTETAELSGSPYAEKYLAYKAELEKDPDLRIYRLQYKWDADNNLDLGFYYIVRLSNYDRGCTLKELIAD